VTDGADFTLDNLPYGVVRPAGGEPRVGVAIFDHVFDLAAAQAGGHLDGVSLPPGVFATQSLNAFLELGPDAWRATRAAVRRLLEQPQDLPLLKRDEVETLLPIDVGDYVDFYASEQHAINMGRLLRPGAPALPAAWRHLPIGYHGRSSTIVVSGAAVPRPAGLVAGPSGQAEFGPTGCLDVEVEVAFVVGTGNERGSRIGTDAATSHVFGAVLLNDWSARDIQRFEAVPLGPFLGKSFATSISPWIVPLDALAPFAVDGPAQDPPPAPYLVCPQPRSFAVHLELSVNGTVVSRPETAALYWSVAQQLAHLTINGAATRAGDLFATGTVSGPTPDTYGSLMELTWAGDRPLHLADGSTRTWLEDGDQVTIRGWCGHGEQRIGFGEVTGTILACPG
jgi:fumarylacetoacetase